MTDETRPSKAGVRDTYDVIAESFVERRRDPWPEVVTFGQDLRRGTRVLDVGCAHGRHAEVLAARGCHVVGVDVSRRLLAIGRTRSRAWSGSARSAWITADATDLPFRGETFGACLLVAVLHHLPTVEDRRSALLEVQRILKPGASAFVSVWSKERARLRRVRGEGGGFLEIEAADVLVPWHLPDGSVAQRYYHLFEEPEFRGLIIGSGLREESFFKSSGNLFAHATRA